MKTDSATAWPISRLKCFQKHVSVNYFSTISDRILNGRHDSLVLNFRRKQTHVTRSSSQLLVFISCATIQSSAACCYGDVLRFSSRCRLSVSRGSFLDLGTRLIIPTGFSVDGRPSGWCVSAIRQQNYFRIRKRSWFGFKLGRLSGNLSYTRELRT